MPGEANFFEICRLIWRVEHVSPTVAINRSRVAIHALAAPARYATFSICSFVPEDAGYVRRNADDEGVDEPLHLVPSATRSLVTDYLARGGANGVDALVAMRFGASPHGAASRSQRSLRR